MCVCCCVFFLLLFLAETGNPKRLSNFTYEDRAMAEMIFKNMKLVSFEGVKSPIAFDSNQDPISTVKIEQVQSKSNFSV